VDRTTTIRASVMTLKSAHHFLFWLSLYSRSSAMFGPRHSQRLLALSLIARSASCILRLSLDNLSLMALTISTGFVVTMPSSSSKTLPATSKLDEPFEAISKVPAKSFTVLP